MSLNDENISVQGETGKEKNAILNRIAPLDPRSVSVIRLKIEGK
jgi:hypothetical protein